jgi:Methylase involved in ubiquinone/menaquinone biosynthesis
MAKPSYDKRTINSANPLARHAQRTRHRRAFQIVQRLFERKDGDLLDFGSHNGAFLNSLSAEGWTGTLYGFDPYADPKEPRYVPVKRLEEIPDRSLDALCAFETLEHVEDPTLEEFIALGRRALRPGGKVIVSVPIMVGPVLLFKYPNAVFVNKSRWRYTLPELFRSAILWKDVPRSKTGPYLDHKGFDYRVLRKTLGSRFKELDIQYSPFPRLGPAANSQVFMCFRYDD